jgi:hypothetical protein
MSQVNYCPVKGKNILDESGQGGQTGLWREHGSSQARDSVLEHLARTVCGASYSEATFVMLSAYFDESISQKDNCLIIAGWLSDFKKWEIFEHDWKIFLAKYDVPYLHMKEYTQSKGPFSKWDGSNWEGTRRNFIHDAAKIVSACVAWGFSCFIPHFVFWRVNRHYELTQMFTSPYALAGWTAIAMVNNGCERIGNTADIKYVFDDGGPDKAGPISSVEKTPVFQFPSFERSRDLIDYKSGKVRKGLVQLQSADYLAYEIRRAIDRHRHSHRKSLLALPFEKIDHVTYVDAGLINTCKRLSIPKR